jgi:hypothetical protein
MFYYASDKSLFRSKVAAVQHKFVTDAKLWYYYYDDMYEVADWKTEPSETLAQLYKEQALRLREKYEYLVLFYSGGYDSTNILETFYYNNIKIDKIVIVGATSQDDFSGDDANRNGELYANAYPYIEKLGLASITELVDYTTYFNKIENFSISQYGDDWVNHTGSWFSPHHWFWRDVEKFVIPDSVGSKKTGLIFGRDKPHLSEHNTFAFTDSVLNAYGNVSSTSCSDRINFYWDPSYPKILVKQLHIIKQVRDASGPGRMGSQQNQIFGSMDTNSIVYSLKYPLLYKSPKSRSLLLSGRDSFLLKTTDSPIHRYYVAGLRTITKEYSIAVQQPICSREYAIA